MNPLDHLKRIKAFAEQLKNNQPITEEQYQYLSNVFERIGNGEDANKVLGLNYEVGQSEAKAEARQRISLALHWIANAILPKEEEGLGYTLPKAFEEAGNNFPDLPYDMLRKYWYQKDKKHMQNPNRGTFDPDSPFNVHQKQLP